MTQYDIEYKKKVLAYLDKNGISAACRKFGHSKSVIYRWKRKEKTVGFVRKKNKTYTLNEKLDILNYYWKNGTTETESKYDINNSVIFKLERLFKEYGTEALSYDGRGRRPNSLGSKKDINTDKDLLEENQMLKMENEYLKKLDTLVQEREERELKKK
ncbi:MAG: hypothetical protein ACK5LZ_04900 [Anaerorhabdus sp.]